MRIHTHTRNLAYTTKETIILKIYKKNKTWYTFSADITKKTKSRYLLYIFSYSWNLETYKPKFISLNFSINSNSFTIKADIWTLILLKAPASIFALYPASIAIFKVVFLHVLHPPPLIRVQLLMTKQVLQTLMIIEHLKPRSIKIVPPTNTTTTILMSSVG